MTMIRVVHNGPRLQITEARRRCRRATTPSHGGAIGALRPRMASVTIQAT